jgi:hypothetical protein
MAVGACGERSADPHPADRRGRGPRAYSHRDVSRETRERERSPVRSTRAASATRNRRSRVQTKTIHCAVRPRTMDEKTRKCHRPQLMLYTRLTAHTAQQEASDRVRVPSLSSARLPSAVPHLKKNALDTASPVPHLVPVPDKACSRARFHAQVMSALAPCAAMVLVDHEPSAAEPSSSSARPPLVCQSTGIGEQPGRHQNEAPRDDVWRCATGRSCSAREQGRKRADALGLPFPRIAKVM